ncbi:rhamnulose-1-phosphate aldolase [Lactococcus lactis]|nr:rhamnulose-1-phosphate aldolase [Lactococcus lactis]
MNLQETKFFKTFCNTANNMYQHGWDERNGGNITLLLDKEEIEKVLDVTEVKRVIPMIFDASELAGKYFLVTGSGKYFKNVKENPEKNIGIIRVQENGKNIDLLWGLEDGAVPTSELPSHFMSHIARLKVDDDHRVVMHCHASHLLAMTFTHDLTEKAMTRTLWQMCTECLVVFPEGVSIIPWLVPGTNEIGEATAKKMIDTRLIIWPFHGIYGSGRDLDETFGLIETAEKAAEIYTYVQAQGGAKQCITDKNLSDLAKAFEITPREGYLNLN